MSVGKAPWGDIDDEFTARVIPYGHNHRGTEESERGLPRNLRSIATPSAEGRALGQKRASLGPNFLVNRLNMWNDFLNEKLRIVEVEIIDLQERTGGVAGTLFHPLMLLLTLVVGLVLFVGVLAIDYAVINEFYSNIYANQYGEVPEGRTASVLVKSLQVVAAALIFHFFFQMLSLRWRKIYTVFIFLVTVMLLVGIGIQNAYTTLPEESAQDTADDDRALLESLGLQPSEPAVGDETAATDDAAAADDGGEWFRTRQKFFWYLSMSVLFVVVTSVAAMILHVSLRALAGLTGRIDNEYRSNRSVMNKRDMRMRLARAHRVRDWLADNDVRRSTLGNAVSWFEEGYMHGLGRSGSAEPLVQQLEAAVQNARNELENTSHQWVIEPKESFKNYDKSSKRQKGKKEEGPDDGMEPERA